MTQEEKIKYFAIAANITGFCINIEQSDMFVSLYELILEKEGEADIRSISAIEASVKERNKPKT